MDVINARTTDVFTEAYDHELSAKAVIAFQRFSGQDAVVGCIQSAAFNVEAFGGVMKYTEYGIPVPLTHPLEGLDKLPDDLSSKSSKKMKGAAMSYAIVRKELPDVAVVANVEGPLTKAGTLTGMDMLAMLMSSNDGLLKDIVNVSIEHTLAFVEDLHNDGSIDSVFIAGATDNPDLFGPELYRRYVLNDVKGITDKVHKMGYPLIFHPHGVFSADGMKETFDMTVSTGIDGFQFAEDNDPNTITKWIDNRCAVLGGTNIVPTLLNGTDDQIRAETKMYVDACREGSHIFMASCSLHRKTDLGRIKVMTDAVRKYGRPL